MLHLAGYFILISVTTALEWRGPTDGAVIHACVEDNVTLPWNVTITREEEIVDIRWYFETEGQHREMMAIFADGNFVPLPTFYEDVEYIPEAALVLMNVRVKDTGNYTVEVNLHQSADAYYMRSRTALLIVAQAPVTSDNFLLAEERRTAMYDKGDNQWHLALTCGNFSSLGHPDVDVIWTTPSGDNQNSTWVQDGVFTLLLPNPVTGGNYTCSLPPDSPTVKCLVQESPLFRPSTVLVDEIRARLALIEAEEKSLKDMYMKRVAFSAKLSSTVTLAHEQRLVLPSVIYNQGNGYNSSSGIFTAPYSGDYSLQITHVPARSDGEGAVFMKVDGTTVIQCDSVLNGDAQTCNLVLHLNARQSVWLSSWSTGYFHAHGTTFSGFLISPDLPHFL